MSELRCFTALVLTFSILPSCTKVEVENVLIRLKVPGKVMSFEKVKVLAFDEKGELLEERVFQGTRKGSFEIPSVRPLLIQAFGYTGTEVYTGEVVLYKSASQGANIYASPLSGYSTLSGISGEKACSTEKYLYIGDQRELFRRELTDLEHAESVRTLDAGYALSCGRDAVFWMSGGEVCALGDDESDVRCESAPEVLKGSGSAVWNGTFLACGGLTENNTKFTRCILYNGIGVQESGKEITFSGTAPQLLSASDGIYIFTGTDKVYTFDGQAFEEFTPSMPSSSTFTATYAHDQIYLYLVDQGGGKIGTFSAQNGFLTLASDLPQISSPALTPCGEGVVIAGGGAFLFKGGGVSSLEIQDAIRFAISPFPHTSWLGGENTLYIINCMEADQ